MNVEGALLSCREGAGLTHHVSIRSVSPSATKYLVEQQHATMRRWTLLGILISVCWIVSCQSIGDFIPPVNETADPCSTVLQPTRGNRVIKTAYAMATLSAIVYYLPFKQGQAIHGFLLRRTGKVRSRFCRLRRFVANILRTILRRKVISPSCHTPKVLSERHPYVLRYWLHGWFEKTIIPGVNFHETDLLIATRSKNTLVISFAGTSSRTDHATNLQTFEPVKHSGIFGNHQGSFHRGFFNAYSRVDRGQVHSLSPANGTHQLHLPTLDTMFHQCTFDRSNRTRQELGGLNHRHGFRTGKIPKRKGPTTLVRRKRGGCFVAGYKLMHLLQELVIAALGKGITVHISGHSLGTENWQNNMILAAFANFVIVSQAEV